MSDRGRASGRTEHNTKDAPKQQCQDLTYDEIQLKIEKEGISIANNRNVQTTTHKIYVLRCSFVIILNKEQRDWIYYIGLYYTTVI